MKRCPKCATSKPLVDFGVCSARAHLDGRQGWCRVCMRQAARERHDAKRDELLAGMRAYYHKNRAAERERSDIYSAARSYARKGGADIVELVHAVVLERADGICGVCGEDVDPLHFDVDHVVPLAHGGEHSYANTQPAHPSCNRSKGDRVAAA